MILDTPLTFLPLLAGFAVGAVVASIKLRSRSTHTLLLRAEKGKPMNQEQIKGKWNQLKGEIKTKWAKMTDNDLLEVEGDMDKLAGRIQERTGDRKEDIHKWLKERSY
jgi:uncharacterized protein YjbJ (UPF0337 family)